MPKFSLKKTIKLVIKGSSTSVIPNPQGIPVAVSMPARTIEIKAGIFDTSTARLPEGVTEQELIDRIRKDTFYNTSEGIIEISEEEQEVVKIKERKMKEAEEEIKEVKKRGRPKTT